jgi:hypothetical protein
MCALRRVADDQAGPAALGILVPTGRRTFLILRPRSLSWDLLLLRAPGGTAFREMGREEATAAAHAFAQALERWSLGSAGGAVETVPAPEGQGFLLRAGVEGFHLLACSRRPGQAYQPAVFADADSARAAADQLASVLCPPAGVEQELYCNTRNFAR